jgi:putative tryptophan/tyrosine transport system substrate-binding protein
MVILAKCGLSPINAAEDLLMIRRREFIAGLGGAAAWPLAAGAQQPAMPVIGFLNSGSLDRYRLLLAGFRQGLNDGGYIEGRNVAIESRWADGQSARLPELAADLVRRRVSLIAATGGAASAHAAKVATATIPVLFITGPDPVADGLVSSLNRPGGNLTGVGVNTSELLPKRLQLLLELIPNAAKIALLLYRAGVGADAAERDVEAATSALGRQMILLKVSSPSDLEAAFASAVRQVDALLVTSNSFFTDRRVEIVALATRHALPAAYAWREFVEAGGLTSYGPNIAWAYRQIGQYASRILKGEKPADLPVMQPTKFEFVINLKAAKALGIEVPPSLLALADEVIE